MPFAFYERSVSRSKGENLLRPRNNQQWLVQSKNNGRNSVFRAPFQRAGAWNRARICLVRDTLFDPLFLGTQRTLPCKFTEVMISSSS